MTAVSSCAPLWAEKRIQRGPAVQCTLTWQGAHGRIGLASVSAAVTECKFVPHECMEDVCNAQQDGGWQIAAVKITVGKHTCECGKEFLPVCAHVTHMGSRLAQDSSFVRRLWHDRIPETKGLAVWMLQELLYWLSSSLLLVPHDAPLYLQAQDRGVGESHGGGSEGGSVARLALYYRAALCLRDCHAAVADDDDTSIALVGSIAEASGRH